MWVVAVQEVELQNYRNRQFSTRLLYTCTPYIPYFIHLYLFYFLGFFVFITYVVITEFTFYILHPNIL